MSWTPLREAAQWARERAYAPYSNYHVGAAVEAEDGTVYAGCNVENASYGAAICAERVALGAMIAAGRPRARRVLVITQDGGTPCGICRQVLSELAPHARVRSENAAGEGRESTTTDLLPDAFTLG